jgi:hypothetical protein
MGVISCSNITQKCIRKVQENQEGLELDKKINTLKKNPEALLEASREVSLDTERTKYVVMSHHQNTGQDHNLQVNSMEKSLF